MTGDKERNEEVRGCPKPKWWMEKHWKMLIRKEGENDEFTTLTGQEISLRDTKHCVGVVLVGGALQPRLMHCKELCGGRRPCFNTCCRPGEAYDEDAMCEPTSNNLSDSFLRDNEDFRGRITMDNFDKAPSFDCPKGYTKNHWLEPNKR